MPPDDTQSLPAELPAEIFAPQQPITPGYASKAYDILTGGNGQERYQLFPERIVRSALSLPTDVMSGKVQTAVSGGNQPLSSDTGPEDELLQRVQDMAALMGGGGIAGAEAKALGSGPMRQFKKVSGPAESHPDYVYHATNVERANDIAEGGSLNLHKPDEFTDQDVWPDGSTQKRNYFTPTAEHTWQFAPEDGQPVLLRINKNDHPFQKESGTGDLYSTKPVPAQKIEYLDQTGKWSKLKPETVKDIDGNELTNYHGEPIQPGPDGKLTLYHRTNEDAANTIKNTGKFKSAENTDETFFADNPDSEYGKGFGDHVVAVKVDPKYVRLNDQFPSGENHYAVPNKFLSKANILKSDNEAAAPIAALENAPVFHSAVENAVNISTLKSANPEQWLGTIKNAKGVKPEELDWTGLKDWLGEQEGPVSKEQVQGYLEQNKVGVGEVNKGEYKPDNLDDRQYSKDLDRIAVRDFGQLYDHIPDSQQQQVRQAALERQNQNPTKYSKYQLPGGENYREKLLTLPSAYQKAPDVIKYMSTFGRILDEIKTLDDVALARHYNPGFAETTKGMTPQEVFDAVPKAKAAQYSDQYQSTHWDEPNILAHIRMNDRNVDGKNALHIEEIQSDWHQQGREHGYKTTPEQKAELETIDQKLMNGLEEKDIGNPDMDAVLKTATSKGVITPAEAANYKQYSKGENSTIPDAPFKKTWLDLALKRVIREAAEGGKDRISWTPGEAQVARYDLSKQVDELHYNPTTHRLIAKNGGNHVLNENSVPPEKLPDYIGKEAAKKLMDQEPNTNGLRSLKGEQLKIGGEGMHYFYDKMLPAALEKLTGQKMKVGSIDTNKQGWHLTPPEHTTHGGWMVKSSDYNSQGTRFSPTPEGEAEARAFLKQKMKQEPINYIDLPQSVKDTALHKGFPLFSSGLMLNPVENDPFKKSKFKLTPVKEAPKFK